MQETGAPEELIQDKLDELHAQGEAVYECLPENYPAIQLYVACYGQFEWIERGEQNVMVGFKRDAIDLEIKLSGIEVTSNTWDRFKELEEITVRMYRQ